MYVDANDKYDDRVRSSGNMSSRSTEQVLLKEIFDAARERWGEEEARLLEPALEGMAEAICEVEGFELDPDEEPWRPSRE